MAIDHRSAISTLQDLLGTYTAQQLLDKLAPKDTEVGPRLPGGGITEELVAGRWAVLPGRGHGVVFMPRMRWAGVQTRSSYSTARAACSST